jgi:predicted nucleotidyltransferase
MPTVPSVIRTRSFGSAKVFWLDRDEALRRLRRAAERALAEHPEIVAVYLFGSLAEDRAVPGSDADVLLLLERSDLRWMDRPLRYGRAFEGVGLPVELFCYTRAEAERVELARRAIADGVRLAGRS